MGKIKEVLTDPNSLFYLTGLDHHGGEAIFVAHEELMEYVYENHSSVSFDTNEKITVTGPSKIEGGDAIRVYDLFDLTCGFILDECESPKAR